MSILRLQLWLSYDKDASSTFWGKAWYLLVFKLKPTVSKTCTQYTNGKRWKIASILHESFLTYVLYNIAMFTLMRQKSECWTLRLNCYTRKLSLKTNCSFCYRVTDGAQTTFQNIQIAVVSKKPWKLMEIGKQRKIHIINFRVFCIIN